MKKHNLLVVAHPDDETIFFGGLVQVYRRRPWKIICVTDGNADGEGVRRKKDFESACHALRAKECEMWDFADRFDERLDLDRLIQRLRSEDAVEVFTHGALGEYGHPHHQDVSLAVYRAFQARAIIWSTAYNCFAEKTHRIPRKAHDKKCAILSKTYFSETNRFARWLPAHSTEGFTRLQLSEVEAVHAFLSGHGTLDKKALKEYAWFEPYFDEFRRQITERPF
ncbi:MAG TPA: PIG-L family deacetylase [Bdellovibrionales bacterium]|nr:PIG-L family deacetylase [Bdellovibrionales bacterium]